MSEPEPSSGAPRDPDSSVLAALADPDARARAISATLMPGFVGTVLPHSLHRRLQAGLGGVCVFGQNIASAAQLRALNESVLAANSLAVIAIDEEGGDVTRLNYADGSPYPGGAVLGRLDDLEATASVAREVGYALRRTACTLDFAPDVDVNSNPDNPVIGVRSFGADAALVARHSAAFTTGIQSAGIAACAKHFPGHGDTALDSHLALPVIDRSLEELRERELVPFRAAIEAGTRTIMTSHIVVPQLDDVPATFSARILQGLLREELGFDGVIVSDALDMKGASGELGIPEAAVRALAAGCDLLCIGTETTDELIDEIIRAVDDAIDAGRLSAERVADAAARVHRLALESEELRAGITVPERSAQPVSARRAVDAFDIDEAALARVGIGTDAAPSGSASFAVVRVQTEANVAVGVAPWGPFAQVVAQPGEALSRAFAGHPQFTLLESEGATGVDALVAGVLAETDETTPIVVIGKALHRYAFARQAIEALRHARPTLAVDMGWPSDDRAYADVATFGASRLIGRALIAVLEGAVSQLSQDVAHDHAAGVTAEDAE